MLLPRLDAPPERFRSLAERDDVLFHGSNLGGLETLEPVRLSRDATAFGDQQAVYATSDPVWAIYFAILRRGKLSTRNASLGRAGGSLFPRRYVFSLRRYDGEERFCPGFLYVVPRATFTCQPPLLGRIDTAQWVSHESVPVLERFDVTSADFPFADLVVTHREREPLLMTLLRQVSKSPAIRRRASQMPNSASTTR